MSVLHEYIITLHDYKDLQDFYDDMETDGGDLYIPNRAIPVSNRRPISRNTHYYLTDEEANLIKQDSRVLSVVLSPSESGLRVKPLFVQTESTWNKNSSNTNTHKNWGLLRIANGEQITNWGTDGTSNASGTITVPNAGKNVDAIVVDGHINPLHPEYAVNSDGSGGSRVIQYNWFQHNSTVWPGNPSNTYIYTPYVDAMNSNLTDNNNHGAHVAGTFAGNTQGWARDSNIYNINPYSSNVNSFNELYLFDYIRAFHAAKPINPLTGVKNPTIVNNSWGYGFEVLISEITAIVYRGSIVVNGTPTSAQLFQYGIDNLGIYAYAPARYSPMDADIQDAINDGIIIVGAAGNDYTKIDVVGGIDYNNYFVRSGFAYFYHQGSTPGATLNSICVGSIGALVNDSKSEFSNTGPRVDIYAPGNNIMSSFNSTTSYGGTDDPRNSTYKIGKINGTSMASPQVAGLLACAAEVYPNLSQAEARQYIVSNAKRNQITSIGSTYTDYFSLQGSENRYAYYKRERPETGNVYPKINYKARPTSGITYPRVRRKTIV